MAINEWDLSETNLERASKRRYEVAVLPLAAIEPHNRHLPEGQDWFHATRMAREACRRAWEQCESVLCLPAIPYGVDCNLMDFPLAIHVSQATLDAMIAEIIESLTTHGIRKIVLLNGHGGNDFKPLVRQIQCDLDVHVFLCDWWKVGADRYGEVFEKADDHAGEMETSLALALFPELVELDSAGDATARPFQFEALEKGWLYTSRRFARLNEQCANADPSGATAEKGAAYFELCRERITAFLVELAQTPIHDDFPHEKK